MKRKRKNMFYHFEFYTLNCSTAEQPLTYKNIWIFISYINIINFHPNTTYLFL